MGNINWARVLLGGLVAGAIILAIDFRVNGRILGSQWQAVLKALGQIQSPRSLICARRSGGINSGFACRRMDL